MGKVFKDRICCLCGTKGRVIETFGKHYCKPCWDKKPKRLGSGNSGMLENPSQANQLYMGFDDTLKLTKVPKSNGIFATLYLQHYPASKGIVGRQCNYIVERCGEILGIISGNSPPLNYKIFNEFFGGYPDFYREVNWLNNNAFRLIRQERNLGTKVLRLFRFRIKEDYEKQYGDELIGLVTFVEPPRMGSVYKADNWKYLGETQGKSCKRRGDHGKWINKEWTIGTKKHIYGYKYGGS